MRVRGLDESLILQVADMMDIKPPAVSCSGSYLQFTLSALSCDAMFARKSYRSARKSRHLCWHGFRDFICLCFDLGADRVGTRYGLWQRKVEFIANLLDLSGYNMGSTICPVYLYLEGLDICTCIPDRMLPSLCRGCGKTIITNLIACLFCMGGRHD